MTLPYDKHDEIQKIQKRLLSRATMAESMILRVGGLTTDAGRTFEKDAKLFRDAAVALSDVADGKLSVMLKLSYEQGYKDAEAARSSTRPNHFAALEKRGLYMPPGILVRLIKVANCTPREQVYPDDARYLVGVLQELTFSKSLPSETPPSAIVPSVALTTPRREPGRDWSQYKPLKEGKTLGIFDLSYAYSAGCNDQAEEIFKALGGSSDDGAEKA